ncbi:MAG: DEAD/DEAH box helicase [Kiritimatiellia bacterium]
MEPLLPHQNRAIDFALDRDSSNWFMPPGFGKTRSWLETIRHTGGRALVIAPKLVCLDTWPRENKKWGYNFTTRFLHGPQRHLRGREQISLINYEALPWLVDKLQEQRVMPYDQVIFDEVSKMKNSGSVRGKAWQIIANRFDYRSGGTGTPVGAHLSDLFGEMLAVDGGESLGASREQFIRKHFFEDPYTRRLEPYHDSEQVILDAIADRAISFDINDLSLPPITHIPHRLTMPDNVREQYVLMHEESAVEDLNLYAVNAAVKSGKLRQMASGGVIDSNLDRRYLHTAKAEYLKQILDDHDGRPVMVFFEFKADYASLCNVLKYDVPALHGATRAADGAKIVRDWNAGRLPVLALHPRSAAYGLNLQDSGNVIVWYTIPWSFEMLNQGTARLWRQGQKHKVMCYYLIVAETIDEDVYSRVGERANTHNRVMRGLL